MELRAGAAAGFVAAGFFALGLAAEERDLFFGPAVSLPLAPAESEFAMSACFFFGSILDFLATFSCR